MISTVQIIGNLNRYGCFLIINGPSELQHTDLTADLSNRVLNIELPAIFTVFIGVFKLFNFDFTFLIAIGCYSDGAYFSSLMVNIVLIGVVVVGSFIFAKYELSQIDKTSHDEETHKAEVQKIFDMFDLDGNGIELDEVAVICRRISPKATAAEIEALFHSADTDGSGVIDFEEFYAAVADDVPDVAVEGSKWSVVRDSVKKKQKRHHYKNKHSFFHHDKNKHSFDLRILVRKQKVSTIKADAMGRLFLLTFLLYPSCDPTASVCSYVW